MISNVVGIIFPPTLVGIGLSDLPKSEGSISPHAPRFLTALCTTLRHRQLNEIHSSIVTCKLCKAFCWLHVVKGCDVTDGPIQKLITAVELGLTQRLAKNLLIQFLLKTYSLFVQSI